MTLRTIRHSLTSWLKALEGADDPLGDWLGSHEQRLVALEGEVRRMQAELRRSLDSHGLTAEPAELSDPDDRTG